MPSQAHATLRSTHSTSNSFQNRLVPCIAILCVATLMLRDPPLSSTACYRTHGSRGSHCWGDGSTCNTVSWQKGSNPQLMRGCALQSAQHHAGRCLQRFSDAPLTGCAALPCRPTELLPHIHGRILHVYRPQTPPLRSSVHLSPRTFDIVRAFSVVPHLYIVLVLTRCLNDRHTQVTPRGLLHCVRAQRSILRSTAVCEQRTVSLHSHHNNTTC